MNQQLRDALEEARQPFADNRFNVCRLELSGGDSRFQLEGTVLDRPTLDSVLAHLRARLPEAQWTYDSVQVLRQARPSLMAVATNMTGWQRDPSWLGEQQSQVLNGAMVEILEEGERWSFGRLEDGYLGWVYTGYLGSLVGVAEPTHVVCEPETLLRREPDADAPLVGRAFAGTRVAAAPHVVAATHDGSWAEVTLAGGLCGYVPEGHLRPLTESLETAAARSRLIADAHRYIGVPYLWGGTTANGIDCSGFAQLMHKLAGVMTLG